MKAQRKVVTKETLKRKIALMRREGKQIVFTNGCFDILHFGHASYLQTAKKKNRFLVIGLNSDRSIKRIKGPTRPIVPQQQRALLLASLECVDYITIFNEETPEKLIAYLKPDVLIKGADWKGKRIAGQDFIESVGGRVEYIDYIRGFSTTTMIERIKKSAKSF